MESAIKEVTTKQNLLSNELNEVVKSQEYINCSYEDLAKTNQQLKDQTRDLSKQNEVLNGRIVEAENKLYYQYHAIDNLEQYGRRDQLEISDFPLTKEDDTDKIITDMIEKLEVPIDRSQVDIIHRLSNNENSSIIVKFTSRTARNLFFQERTKLKDLTIADFGYTPGENSKNKIFINESLITQEKKILFKKVRERCSKAKYKFSWTRQGVIYVKKDDKSKTSKIFSESDLHVIRITPRNGKSDDD